MRSESTKKLLRQARDMLDVLEQKGRSGVLVAESDEEFERLAATLPPAGPGECGVLLVPPQSVTVEEWEAESRKCHHPDGNST